MAFPATYNFNYYQGDTFTFTMLPKNSDGTPFDLTGYTPTFTVATERGTAGTTYTCTATIDTVNSTVTCTISNSVGKTFNASIEHVYDVQITQNANVYTLVTGTITTQREITGAV